MLVYNSNDIPKQKYLLNTKKIKNINNVFFIRQLLQVKIYWFFCNTISKNGKISINYGGFCLLNGF